MPEAISTGAREAPGPAAWATSEPPGRPGDGATPAPLLAGLGLSADECLDLARQGFVCREDRGGSGPYYKLRFRSGGRQVVRYLGKDPGRAQAVARELQALQAPARLRRQLRDLAARARRALRSSRREAEGALRERGHYFHGNTVRRRRTGAVGAQGGEPPPG